MTTFSAIICTRYSRLEIVKPPFHVGNQHIWLLWSTVTCQKTKKNNKLPFHFSLPLRTVTRWLENIHNQQIDDIASVVINIPEEKTKAKVQPFERTPCFSSPSIAPSISRCFFLRHKYRKIMTSMLECFNDIYTQPVSPQGLSFYCVRINSSGRIDCVTSLSHLHKPVVLMRSSSSIQFFSLMQTIHLK